MPDSGASMVMYSATSAPAASPVNRASDASLDMRSTTLMRTNAIVTSATNATPTPEVPGLVAT